MTNCNVVSRKIILAFSFGLMYSFTAQGQSTGWLMKNGNKFFKNENYRASIPFYEQVLEKEDDHALAYYRAGVSYLSFDKEQASEYLYKAQRLKPKVANDIEYWLGRVDHVNYRFEDAIKHYQLFIASLKKKDEYQKEEVNLLITQSRNALKMFSNPKDYFVRNLGPNINTPFSDHSPVLSKDGKLLLFTTRSQSVTHGREAADGEYYEHIVETTRLEDNSWSKPRSLSAPLNSKGHDASIQLLESDTKLLLYRQTNNGDFYVSERAGDDWGVPKRLNGPVNTDEYESDAFITADGSTMYFSTTHFSEDGDKDIYVAKKTAKGEWGKPKSMGKTINTSFDEDSPFLTQDGKTMYFTSRGHNTMGGNDVFVTRFDSVSRRWTKPENMGYPINSPDDDTYFRLNADGTVAYLSSYRMGGYGEKDIWSVDFSQPVVVKGKVTNQQTGKALPEMEILLSSKPLDKKPVEFNQTTQADSGTFNLQVLSGRTYHVTFSKNGKTYGTQEFVVPAYNNPNKILIQDFNLSLEKETASELKLEVKKNLTHLPVIYFQKNQLDLTDPAKESLKELVVYLNQNPEKQLSIEGHTDESNTDAYNLILGKNRAQKVCDYLIKNGISQNRLKVISYGKRRPVVTTGPTKNKNRRVEFSIITAENDHSSKL